MKKLTFFTGAGISAESGIKTFRDSDGLWENHNVMDVASVSGWRKNKDLVLEFYNQRYKQLSEVEPNDGHKLISDLQKTFDVNVITQNVDNLHERAGTEKVLHLHGELTKMCSSMDKEQTLPYKEIKIGDKHPDGSQLRPYIVWFGEDVPMFNDAIKLVKQSEVFVIVGTSLQVYPAASLIDFVNSKTEIYYIDPNPSFDDIHYTLKERINVIKKIGSEGMKDLYEKLTS